jgi:hypothetical protein
MQLLLTGLAMMIPLFVAGAGLAQVQRYTDDRETRRIERRINELEKEQDAFKLDIEKRLGPIETYVKIAVALLTLIATAYAGQVTWTVAERRRRTHASREQKDNSP